MLTLISFCGLAAMLLCFPMLFRETTQRRDDAVRQMHTRFVAENCHLEPIDLYASQMVIGRLERRCDISLAGLAKKGKKSPISKVHARLWWDGLGFRIAPIPSRNPDGSINIPKVWVEMDPVDDCTAGAPVAYRERISLGSIEHTFFLEDTSSQFPDQASDYYGEYR